jgi:hypothetical protein
METVDSWKALTYIQQTAGCHIQDDGSLNIHALKNLNLTRCFLFRRAIYQLYAITVHYEQINNINTELLSKINKEHV